MKIEIAISPCPNDVFIYSGLILGATGQSGWKWHFNFLELEELNQAALDNRFDAVKISYAHYPRIDSQYQLLSCGGALGRNCGPLLITGGNPFSLENEILIPGEYTTAHLLLNSLLREEWGEKSTLVRKRFLRFDHIYSELLQNPSAQGVIIHELRFTYAQDGLNLVRDLGAAWENRTGYPIPLGALVLKKSWSAHLLEVESQVRASLDWAYAHEDQALTLCHQYAQSMETSVLKAHIQLYVNEFSRQIGTAGQAAVDFLLSQVVNKPI